MAPALSLRSRVAARAGGWAAEASRRLGGGEGLVIGGRVSLALDPSLLAGLTRDRAVALVSGTNGKTTTTRLLASALMELGPVAHNSGGANLPSGLVPALAGSPAGAPAALEVDEGWLGAVADAVSPGCVVLLNLSRDQLDRVSEVRNVASRWRSVVERLGHAVVVANADDPMVVWASRDAARVRWVAGGQSWREDAAGCPSCSGRIDYDSEGWRCGTGCGLERPAPAAWVSGSQLVVPGKGNHSIELALPGRFNLANAAMAAVAAAEMGVPLERATAAMSQVTGVDGRYEVTAAGGISARLLLAKNPAGWAELFDVLTEDVGPAVFAINARVADGRDPSWLWDVPFERLAGRLVVASGERWRDLAVRLRYAGVDHVCAPDPLASLELAAEHYGTSAAVQVDRCADPGVTRDFRSASDREGEGRAERAVGEDRGRRIVDVVANYTAFQRYRAALRPLRDAPRPADQAPVSLK